MTVDPILMESFRSGDYRPILLEFGRLFDYEEPNDRAIAIVGCVFLDKLLEELLVGFMIDDSSEVAKLIATDRALGSLGARISACYCLGLIGETVRDDLRLIARIRNRFAHDLSADFNDSKVRGCCSGLRWHRYSMGDAPEDAGARDLFQVGVNQLVTYLIALPAMARRFEKRTPQTHGRIEQS